MKLSVDGTLVVSGASDGRVRLWNVNIFELKLFVLRPDLRYFAFHCQIPQKKLIFDVSCNESEVADIDMSFDSKQVMKV